ncbi:MAG TPA: DUF3105 domain-containing protein [Aldersonia sp.]
MPTGSNGRPSDSTGAKSAKAIKAAAGKKKPAGAAGKGIGPKRQIPWMTIGAVVVVVGLIGLIAWNLIPKYQTAAEAEKYTPSETNRDPSTAIEGVVKIEYPAALHVQPTQRVAYDQSPPFGGPHDAVWATCTGVVYPNAIRSENAVHSLEHGAAWITYNPDLVDQAGIDTLAAKVDGQQYLLMSPYPGLDKAVSVQSWGHQLKVDSPDDERIDQFITALRLNQYTYPEVGASCSTIPGSYDPDNPPPFDSSPLPADAVQMDGAGLTPDASEMPAAGLGGLPTGDIPAPAPTP